MKRYIGTKEINAIQMNRLDYNIFRGWDLPSDENGADEGYLVEYIDGGSANTSAYKGYVSWSPADVFNKAYTDVSAMSFGDALVFLKQGHKVARSGWNGKCMHLQLVETDFYSLLESKIDGVKTGPEWNLDPFIVMKTAANTLVPWLASQTDVLAEDWCIVN